MENKERVDKFKFLNEYNYYGSYEEYIKKNGKREELFEMSNLRKSRSGLPVNLWLDDSMNYTKGKHWKRVKFQKNTADKMQPNNLGVMTIEDEPKVIGQHKLSQDVINDIRKWIIQNKELLSKLADMDIDFGEFIEQMKRHGEPNEPKTQETTPSNISITSNNMNNISYQYTNPQDNLS